MHTIDNGKLFSQAVGYTVMVGLGAWNPTDDLAITQATEETLEALHFEAPPVSAQSILRCWMTDDGWRPFNGVNFCYQGCINETCALKDVIIRPVGILGTQAIADGVVLQRKQGMQQAQAKPPITVDAGHVDPGRGIERQQTVAPKRELAALPRAHPGLGRGVAAVDLRSVPPMRDVVGVGGWPGRIACRARGVLPPSAERVRVDEMNRGEAAQLLIAGAPEVGGGVVAGLLAATGRWPVLLSLVNGAVRADLNAGRRAEESMCEILHELRTTGPTALDVTDADERHMAVARTIGVSLARLTPEKRDRYLELAVCGEDVAIPGAVLSRYWKATGGWSAFQTRRYCQRLAELALVSDYRQDPDRVVLHDVIRAYLREKTQHRRSELDRMLIDAHRSLVPQEGTTSAWGRLATEHR